MSRRRRFGAGATLAAVVALAVVITACGSDTSDPDVANSVSSTATTIAATSTATTSTNSTTSTTSPSSTTTSSTTTTVPACTGLEIVVLGNSTDYWPNYEVGVDEPTDDAWPAILQSLLRHELPDTEITVENGSVLGAGFDIGLYGVTSMSERLDSLATSSGGSAVLLLAPSVVDLQLRSLDVDASFVAFTELYRGATSAFRRVIVLPMNPVAVGFDPDVARAVDAFNRRLVDSELVDGDDVSPLLLDDGPFGRTEFYDDFDDGRLDTPGPDPDGLHPDVDGHLVIAAAVTAHVTSMLPVICN